MPQRRVERSDRITQIWDLLRAQPDCWFTAGMVAQHIGLSRSPYLLRLLDELVAWPDARVFKAPVVRLGKKANGFYYSEKLKQQSLEMESCL